MAAIADTLETLDLDTNWFNISKLQDLGRLQSLIKNKFSSFWLKWVSNTTPFAKFNGNLFTVQSPWKHNSNRSAKLCHPRDTVSSGQFNVQTDFPVKLDKLWLSCNDFEIIPVSAFGSLASPSHLSVFYLNRNNIQYIDEGAFNGLPLKELYIDYKK